MGVIDGTGKLPATTNSGGTAAQSGPIVMKVSIPGPRGFPGVNAFTLTSGTFVMPPPDDSTTVAVEVLNADWMGVLQPLFVETAGQMKVVAIVSPQSVLLVNGGASGNATSGTTIPLASRISPGGVPGEGGSGPSSSVQPITFQPNGTAGTNVFVTEGTLSTAISPLRGVQTVYLDFTALVAGGPFSFSQNNDFGDIWIGFWSQDSTGSTAPLPVIHTNGQQVTAPMAIRDVHLVQNVGSSAFLTTPAYLRLSGDAALYSNDGTGVIYNVSGIQEIEMFDGAQLGIGNGNPAFSVGGGAVLSIAMFDHASLVGPGLFTLSEGSVQIFVYSSNVSIDESYFSTEGITIQYVSGNANPGPITFHPGGVDMGNTFASESTLSEGTAGAVGPFTTYMDFSSSSGNYTAAGSLDLGAFAVGVLGASGIAPVLHTAFPITSPLYGLQDLGLVISDGVSLPSIPNFFRMTGNSSLAGADGFWFYIVFGTSTIEAHDNSVIGDGTHIVILIGDGGSQTVKLFDSAALEADAFFIGSGSTLTIQVYSPSAFVDPSYVGITGVTIEYLSLATQLAYTPAVSGNWSPAPAIVSDALDQLAARSGGGGSGSITFVPSGTAGSNAFLSESTFNAALAASSGVQEVWFDFSFNSGSYSLVAGLNFTSPYGVALVAAIGGGYLYTNGQESTVAETDIEFRDIVFVVQTAPALNEASFMRFSGTTVITGDGNDFFAMSGSDYTFVLRDGSAFGGQGIGVSAGNQVFDVPSGATVSLYLYDSSALYSAAIGVESGGALTIYVCSDAAFLDPSYAGTTGVTIIYVTSATGLGYTPATPGNWSPTPDDVGDALDQLAGRGSATLLFTATGGAAESPTTLTLLNGGVEWSPPSLNVVYPTTYRATIDIVVGRSVTGVPAASFQYAVTFIVNAAGTIISLNDAHLVYSYVPAGDTASITATGSILHITVTLSGGFATATAKVSWVTGVY